MENGILVDLAQGAAVALFGKEDGLAAQGPVNRSYLNLICRTDACT